MSEYYEGICGDGVAILKDGELMTISEILMELDNAETLRQQLEHYKTMAANRGMALGTRAARIASLEQQLAEARAWRVPEQLTCLPATVPYGSKASYVDGWNDCRLRMLALNAQAQPQQTPDPDIIPGHGLACDAVCNCGKDDQQQEVGRG